MCIIWMSAFVSHTKEAKQRMSSMQCSDLFDTYIHTFSSELSRVDVMLSGRQIIV